MSPPPTRLGPDCRPADGARRTFSGRFSSSFRRSPTSSRRYYGFNLRSYAGSPRPLGFLSTWKRFCAAGEDELDPRSPSLPSQTHYKAVIASDDAALTSLEYAVLKQLHFDAVSVHDDDEIGGESEIRTHEAPLPAFKTARPLIRWRRGWDSNPRKTCAFGGFQDRCLKPLGHLSPSATDSMTEMPPM